MCRIKITINYNEKYENYKDIVDINLLDKINNLFKYKTNIIKYVLFQKSNCTNNYGIIITLNYFDKEIYNIYDYIKDDEDLKVFAYKLENDEKVTYLTDNNKLIDKYFNKNYYISLESFIQADIISANFIHNTVKSIINYNFPILGLGGLSAIYTNLNNNNNNNLVDIILSNNSNIVDDCITNKINSKLVDYNNVKIKDYIDNSKIYTLIINISKSGLNKLSKQIVKINFAEIIYISCNYKSFNKDNIILSKLYTILHIYKFNNFYVIHYI